MKKFLIDMAEAFRDIPRDLMRFSGREDLGGFWVKSTMNILVLIVVLGPLLVVNYQTAAQLEQPLMSRPAIVVAAVLFILAVTFMLNLPLIVRRLRDVQLPGGAYMITGAATIACWLIPGLNAMSGMPMNVLVLIGCFAPTAWGLRFGRKA